MKRPRWRNGIRDGLKIRWASARAGSNPALGTMAKMTDREKLIL